MIAICLPSRGLVFSRTIQSVIQGMQALNGVGLATSFHISHDLPIPDCHNYVVSEALKSNAQRVIIVEEDNFVFPETMIALATTNFDVALVQYNDRNGSPHGIIHYNEAGEVLWGGLGSTSVSTKVLKSLGTPFFRIDHLYKNIKKKTSADGKLITTYQEIEPKQVWNDETHKFEEKRDTYKYGGLDIDFYTRVRDNGFSIGVLENHKGHHFELVKLGEKHENNGCHVIKQV